MTTEVNKTIAVPRGGEVSKPPATCEVRHPDGRRVEAYYDKVEEVWYLCFATKEVAAASNTTVETRIKLSTWAMDMLLQIRVKLGLEANPDIDYAKEVTDD